MNEIEKNKQTDENISLLREIVRQLEWSRVEHRYDLETRNTSLPFRICPLCGGVKGEDYEAIVELHADRRLGKGHSIRCLFLKID